MKKTKKKQTPTPAVSRIVAKDPLVEVLRRGGDLSTALVAVTRDLLKSQDRVTANAIAQTLRSDPDTADLGRLLAGIIAAAANLWPLAWSELRDVPESLWAPHAAREFASTGLRIEPDEVLTRLSELAERGPESISATAWLSLIGPVFGYGDHALAAQLFARLDAAVEADGAAPRSVVINRDWLRPWVGAHADGATAPDVAEGSVSFAIMAYGHPGRSRASANIGDHVQSLASLGHLARHQALDYDGPQDLVDLMAQLRGRVRPALQRHDARGRVELIQIDRDASMYSAIPRATWTLAFGWYMHAIFGTRYGFPFHPNLLPIFVSIHCSKRDLLTDEAIDYLRQFAPIGCRDWTTVDILLSVGVPAFFSGCLTTTTRTVFPETVDRPGEDAPIAYVDMPPATVRSDAPRHAHSSDAIRFRSFATNMADAIALLELYRREYRALVTSRLHCYLPMRSLGTPVDFRPGNRSDPRFAGLIDITDAEFTSIQTTIEQRLESVITAIMSGGPADEVYALWRELNRDDVEAAQSRRACDHPLPAVRSGIEGEVATLGELITQPQPDATVVVVSLPARRVDAARVLIDSVVRAASGPVEFWILSQTINDDNAAGLRDAAGDHRVTFVDTRGLGNDLRAAGRQVAQLDRESLAVPGLLTGAARAVFLPVDSIVLGDIAELANIDLRGRLLAAPDPAGKTHASGFEVLNGAANRLKGATAASAELRRRAYGRHRCDFDAFSTEVLVIDLEQWRETGVTAAFLPFVEEFGLSFHELLHLIVGPDRTALEEKWHTVPGRSAVADPLLLHWSESAKPWTAEVAVDQHHWLAARDQLNDHARLADHGQPATHDDRVGR